MKFAIIKDNIVINIIEAEQDFIDQNNLNGVIVEQNTPCSPGWTYDNGQFIKPIETDPIEENLSDLPTTETDSNLE